jgi:hypothetical protein
MQRTMDGSTFDEGKYNWNRCDNCDMKCETSFTSVWRDRDIIRVLFLEPGVSPTTIFLC